MSALVLPVTRAPLKPFPRLAASFRQRRTPVCPQTPRLDGRVALVTGATGGIGLETARGLLARGAELLMPCRTLSRGDAAARAIARDSSERDRITLVPFDLADLDTVRAATATIAGRLAGRTIDILVENAGVWPSAYARTPQGHEIAFGTNVLGHFALRESLRRRELLAPRARVVLVTGDIYVLAAGCTPDYVWQGPAGGRQSYCRSKLGVLWIGAELVRRAPSLETYVVHPGVIDTGLAGPSSRLRQWIKSRVLIDATQGAQTSLVCATQPGLERGGYYHNACGRMQLDPRDTACDRARGAKLWDTCVELCAPFV
jgi:NAD(P)-dependent dehydrogenase (short-subunit alcohol dehydrogenase family)